jgi:hypothetical protein
LTVISRKGSEAMSGWSDIDYRDFWDQPRIFFVHHEGHLILFDCAFDNEREDYRGFYSVYLMPELSADDFSGSWAGLGLRAARKLGEIPLTRVQFDPTKRRQIDVSVLDSLLARPARLSG